MSFLLKPRQEENVSDTPEESRYFDFFDLPKRYRSSIDPDKLIGGMCATVRELTSEEIEERRAQRIAKADLARQAELVAQEEASRARKRERYLIQQQARQQAQREYEQRIKEYEQLQEKKRQQCEEDFKHVKKMLETRGRFSAKRTPLDFEPNNMLPDISIGRTGNSYTPVIDRQKMWLVHCWVDHVGGQVLYPYKVCEVYCASRAFVLELLVEYARAKLEYFTSEFYRDSEVRILSKLASKARAKLDTDVYGIVWGTTRRDVTQYLDAVYTVYGEHNV